MQQEKAVNTINFIQRMHIFIRKKITYAQFYCDIWLQKGETNCTRLTVNEDRLKYNRRISTETTK